MTRRRADPQSTAGAGATGEGPAVTAQPAIKSDTYPADLRERAQWLTWKVTDDGRKVPRAPYVHQAHVDRFVSAQDPDVWTTFAEASQWADRLPTHGLAFTIPTHDDRPDDPYVLVDDDDARDPETGTIHPAVRETHVAQGGTRGPQTTQRPARRCSPTRARSRRALRTVGCRASSGPRPMPNGGSSSGCTSATGRPRRRWPRRSSCRSGMSAKSSAASPTVASSPGVRVRAPTARMCSWPRTDHRQVGQSSQLPRSRTPAYGTLIRGRSRFTRSRLTTRRLARQSIGRQTHRPRR